MLFSILACLGSLAWAFVFLALIMFMFAIFFLQGSVHAIQDMDPASQRYELARELSFEWFGSLGGAMLSLLATVTGGIDWLEPMKALNPAGGMYLFGYVAYMLFVTVGVMNVLTGVFLCSAEAFTDFNLVVQKEDAKVEMFVDQILDLFKALDINHTGVVDWTTFSNVLKDDAVRSYFASLEIEPTHIRLIFDLLDPDHQGKIDVHDFVTGMVRLKGEAKAVDARIIQRQLDLLPVLLEKELEKGLRQFMWSGAKSEGLSEA